MIKPVRLGRDCICYPKNCRCTWKKDNKDYCIWKLILDILSVRILATQSSNGYYSYATHWAHLNQYQSWTKKFSPPEDWIFSLTTAAGPDLMSLFQQHCIIYSPILIHDYVMAIWSSIECRTKMKKKNQWGSIGWKDFHQLHAKLRTIASSALFVDTKTIMAHSKD